MPLTTAVGDFVQQNFSISLLAIQNKAVSSSTDCCAMKDLSITYAHDLEGNLVHIGNATKGERYFCVECKDELNA